MAHNKEIGSLLSNHEVVVECLGEPVEHTEEISGGLFNTVFRVRGKTRAVFVKTFADTAKDPAFPPLPTSALARGRIAALLNTYADSITVAENDIRSARLFAFEPGLPAVVVESVPGVPLQTLLINPATLDEARRIIFRIASWLPLFHAKHVSLPDDIADVALQFKKYKSDLQYYRMLDHLSDEVREQARIFADSHIASTRSVILGDLNSRNVLVDSSAIRLIDFEQGHIGDGEHDLAYLVSELVIADIATALSPENDILTAWKYYSNEGAEPVLSEKYYSYRRHCAFQVLYRLKGPSRKAWSGHIPPTAQDRILHWCSQQFEELFP